MSRVLLKREIASLEGTSNQRRLRARSVKPSCRPIYPTTAGRFMLLCSRSSVSELPWRDNFQPSRPKVRPAAGGQSAAMNPRDGRDHAV